MTGWLRRYARWLHTGWPAGRVEPLPEVRADGDTAVSGLYVTGDLTGVPLLKFALDTGARAVRTILASPGFAAGRAGKPAGVRDLAIIGAGVSGMAAAVEARKAGLDILLLEAARPFQSVADFPKAKPIYTYPKQMTPAGDLRVTADIKEALFDELVEQTRSIEVTAAEAVSVARAPGCLEVRLAGGAPPVRALRVIVAIGRSGNFRRLDVPGEDLDTVHHRLHDPADFKGRKALVVGGGDSALETAAALARSGAEVTLAHRGRDFPRAKPENVEALRPAASAVGRSSTERPGSIRIERETRVAAIRQGSVDLEQAGGRRFALPNDVVFAMIGREPPLDFFRRSGVRIAGEWTGRRVAALVLFMLGCLALYDWKSGGWLDEIARRAGAFPYSLALMAGASDPKSLAGITLISAQSPSFWYTLAYSAIIVAFGFKRIRTRRTPYVKIQTLTLMAIQVLPLFLLPEIILPWLDAHGALPLRLADALFPRVDYGHGREFWRAYGFILAWPLNVYNVFTDAPLWGWLAIAFVQTFVLIPALIYFFGKGAYCGWICSCGALAETLGDSQRHKMPHGPGWNRLNLAGQAVLLAAVVLLALRIVSWVEPGWEGLRHFNFMALSGTALSYKWTVDVFLAGVLGYGAYFWLSGRVWCRFFCPLAALMHIYARFSRFRILADKKKCISCNVCTTVCHQGIDVMNFANKGEPMADPECVRCSACVSSCPTGVLSFGQIGRDGRTIRIDRLPASPVQMKEGH